MTADTRTFKFFSDSTIETMLDDLDVQIARARNTGNERFLIEAHAQSVELILELNLRDDASA